MLINRINEFEFSSIIKLKAYAVRCLYDKLAAEMREKNNEGRESVKRSTLRLRLSKSILIF